MSTRHQPGYLPWDRTGNRLLIQSSLGRNKPTSYDIPDDNFVYGRLTDMDPEKANDVMYQWKYHQNSQNKNIGKSKDLVATNKKAIKSLLSTAHQNYEFRKTQTMYKPVKQGNKNIKIYLPQDGFTYGKPGELEDPIKLLMANDYGETDGVMRSTMYHTKIQKDKVKKRMLSCHITKNHNLQKQATQKKMQQFEQARAGLSYPHWKLTKYNAVGPKVYHDPKNLPKNFQKQGGNSKHSQNGSQASQYDVLKEPVEAVV